MKIRHRAWLSRKRRVAIAFVVIAAGYHWFGVAILSVVVLAFMLYELLVPPPRYRQFGSDQQKEAVDNSMGHSGGSYLEQGPAYDFAPKVGRNEPCPCGSGRKFKRCCGRTEMEG